MASGRVKDEISRKHEKKANRVTRKLKIGL